MVVGILVIVWVVVLRSMYQKKLLEDQQKAGHAPPGPASFETLKTKLGEISDRLAVAEDDYQQLTRRIGGPRS
jgi:hypothetical protein